MLREHAHENVEHRAGQDLGQVVRLERAGKLRHRLLVSSAAQIGVIADGLAELLGQVGQQLAPGKVAARLLQEMPAECIVAERHEDGGEVAQEFVEGGGLRADRLVGSAAAGHRAPRDRIRG